MPMRVFRSMRLKLALSYMLIFGLIQTAACILVIWQREAEATSEFDSCLEEQARAMAKVIEIAADGSLSRYDIDEVRKYARAFGCADYFHEIRHADGSLLESSANLEGIDLGPYLPPTADLRERQTVIQDILRDDDRKLPGGAVAMRMLSYYHVPKEGSPFIIQVAMDLEPLYGLNSNLRWNFLRVSLLALAAAGLTSWLLSTHSLKPIHKVEDEVARIDVNSLGQRIDVDDTADELVELTNTVNDLLARLDNAFVAQNNFLTHAAHELKTPLAALLGDAQRLLTKERDVAAYESHLSDAESEYRRLAKTIDSLLVLAKAHAGMHDLHQQPVSANDFATEAIERCQDLARHREVRLIAEMAYDQRSEKEPIVLGDEQLLTAMVENIVRNGVRLTPVGSKVEVSVSMMNDSVQIAVRDEGPGIREDQRDILFEAFVSNPVEGHTSGGTGIGLAIAKGVARLHGGDITVKNRSSVGADFIVTLPHYDPHRQSA